MFKNVSSNVKYCIGYKFLHTRCFDLENHVYTIILSRMEEAKNKMRGLFSRKEEKKVITKIEIYNVDKIRNHGLAWRRGSGKRSIVSRRFSRRKSCSLPRSWRESSSNRLVPLLRPGEFLANPFLMIDMYDAMPGSTQKLDTKWFKGRETIDLCHCR